MKAFQAPLPEPAVDGVKHAAACTVDDVTCPFLEALSERLVS